MPYSDFTIRKVKQAFGLTTIEGEKFLPEITPIGPSSTLNEFLAESLPLAIATGSENKKVKRKSSFDLLFLNF